MGDPDTSEKKEVEKAEDEPAKAEYFALGCGCLLTILIFKAAIWLGFARG